MHILVIDDDEAVRDSLRELLTDEGHQVRTAGSGHRGLRDLERGRCDLAFVSIALPDTNGLELLRHLRLTYPALATVAMVDLESATQAMAAREASAWALVHKPDDLAPERILRLISELPNPAHAPGRRLIGTSIAIHALHETIERVGPADANLLIVGESGTGKELVAEAIHAASGRSGGPLVKLRCATWSRPADVADSIRQASHGSLVLDEITEIPVDLQLRLRLILEEGKLRNVRGRVEPVDVRLISLTRWDPDTSVRDRKLRADLCYRLDVLRILVPPLRERLGDVSVLADHFLSHFSERYRRAVVRLGADAYRALVRHPWPGNVRELEHVIEGAVLVARGAAITADDLPEGFGRVSSTPPAEDIPAAPRPAMTLEAREREAILEALRATRWNKQAAAAMLGLHRPTLYSKMRKHGIPVQRPQP